MPKQLNVNLAFSADTSQAKAQLQDLQNQLTKLTQTSFGKSNSLGITNELKNAATMAAQLKVQLEGAMNPNGTLDLGKFNDALVKSKTSIMDYKNALVKMGPEGSQAFAKLASSITNAEIPLKRSNTLLTEFATTLKNTARWQISSSVLHSFIGTLQSAVGYAKDLNASLTDIGIVTGNSTSQMAMFAEQANKSAQALSSTTTEYTKAALIFYQQGLDGDAVKERTDATIKMAQATGDSAAEVSSYMTAIWNNFDDGSESLEHYADVITALGASTASSSSEIASGLQQFAAIAKTTGLSYDYATSALATLVANTRQSADTIGNSLKTIFSRLQGLQMGETLDDGLDLNKYSKALKAIGIDVLDVNGNMMEMDDVLDATAEKWETMTQAQRMAFAQTVAGTKQYTQLMSLMDNWDDMQTNLQTAETADGTLSEQADRYAESWEGARDRVKAAAEAIYQDLLDERVFIAFDNALAETLKFVDELIDGLGGLPGVLGIIGAAVTRIFNKQIATSLSNMMYNLKMQTTKGLAEVQNRRAEANEALRDKMVTNTSTSEGQAQGAAYQRQAELQQTLIDNAEKLNEEEQRYAQLLLEANAVQSQQAVDAGKVYDVEKKKSDALKEQISQQMIASSLAKKAKDPNAQGITSAQIKSYKDAANNMKNLVVTTEKLKSASTQMGGILSSNDNSAEKLSQLKSVMSEFNNEIMKSDTITDDVKNGWKDLFTGLETGKISIQEFKAGFRELQTQIDENGVGTTNYNTTLQELINKLIECGMTEEQAASTAQNLVNQFNAEANAAANSAEANRAAGEGAKWAKGEMEKLGASTYKASQGFVDLMSLSMSLVSTFSAIKNAINIWNDDSLSDGEKFLQTITALIPAIMSLTMMLNGGKVAQMGFAVATAASKIPLFGEAAAAHLAAETTWTFKDALIEVLIPLALIKAAIVAVIAVIKAIIKAFKDAEARKPKRQLEAAKEKVEELTEKLNEAKDKANELKSAFNQYQTVRDALDNCKEGTSEWYSALNDVNTMVLELLTKYPELAQYLTNENGVLGFTKEGMETVAENAQQNVYGRQGEQFMAQNDVAEKNTLVFEKIVSDAFSEFDRERGQGTNYSTALPIDVDDEGHYTGINKVYTAIADAFASGKSQEEIEQIVGDFATQSFANAAKNAGVILGEDATDRDYAIAELERQGAVLQDGETYGDILDQFIQSDIDLFKDSFKDADVLTALQNYSNAINNQTTQAEALSASMATNILSQDKAISSLDNSAEIINRGADFYNQLIKNKVKDYSEADWGNNDEGTGKDLLAKYQLFSGENLKEAKVTNEGIKYKDSKDEEQILSKEDIINYVAAAEAAAGLSGSIETLIAKVQELSASTDSASKGLKDFLLNNDMSKSTFAENQALQDTVNNTVIEKSDGTKVTGAAAYIDKMFGDGKNGKIADSTAQKYGYETGEAMVQAFEQALEDANVDWDKLDLDGIEGLSDVVKKNLTLENAIDLKELIDQGEVSKLGEDAGEDISKGISDVLKDIKVDDQAAVLQTLLDVDWSKWDAGAEAIAILHEQGIEIDATSEAWNTLINTMRDANDEIPDFSQLKADFYDINKAIHSIEETGDTISLEDYQKIIGALSDPEQIQLLEDSFVQVDDKTVKFIGDVKDLSQIDLSALTSQMDELQRLKDGVSTENQNTIFNADLETNNDTNLSQLRQDMSALADDDAMKPVLEQFMDAQETIDNMSFDRLKELYTALQEFLNGDYDSSKLKEAVAATAQTIEELESIAGDDEGLFNKLFDSVFDTEMTNLGFDPEEVRAYADVCKNDLSTGLQELVNSYNEAQKAGETLTKEQQEQKEAAEELLKDEEKLAHQALLTAKAEQRIAKGTKELIDNWDDWKDTLEQANKELKENGKISSSTAKDLSKFDKAIKSTMKDLLNMSDEQIELLPEDFAAKNKDLLEDVMNGVEGAYEDFVDEAAKALANSFDESAFKDGFLDGLDLSEALNNAQNQLFELGNIIDGFEESLDPIELEAQLNSDEFLAQCNAMIQQAGLTSTAVQSYFAAMGYDVEITEDPEEIKELSTTKDNQYWEPAQYAAGETIPEGGSEHPGEFHTVKKVSEGRWVSATDSSTEEYAKPGAFAVKTITPSGAGSGGGVSRKTASGGGGGRGGGGGGRRGGGGSRGRERSYVAKQHTDTSHQKYEKIGKQLGSLTDAYSKVSKAADKAFGGERIKFLNQQIALQEKIIKKTREQAKESQRLANEERKNLTSGNKGIESYYTDSKTGTEYHDKFSLKDIAGVNATTDGFGNITNKADILKGLDEAYNQATAAYNASAQEDADKAVYERIKAQIDAAKEALSTYEEDLENAASDADALLEELYNQYDLVLQKASEKVDIKINVDEEALKYIDYILGTIEDNAWKAADAIGYFGQQASHLMSESKTYKNGIADIIDRHNEAMKLDGGTGLGIKGSDFVKKLQSGELTPEMLSATGAQLDPYDASTYTMQNLGLTQDEVDKMQEYADNLLAINEQLEQSRANVFETMEQAFDKMNEEMSDNIVKIQHYQKLTQNYNNIIDIVGKKALGITSEMTRAMGEAQTAVAKNLVESSRVKMETLQQEMAEAEEKRAAAQAKGLDKDVEYWDKFLKHAEEEYESAQEDFMQNWEDALQTAADVFAATVDDICATLDDALAGTAGSLESLRNSFDMQNEIDDDYVDDYERVYQLTKLTRNIEKSIDDTDNIKSKKELLKLQEEINDQLENNKEMSQYDLDYLQKKYELKMAELALEEAKDAKSNVSMVKGNDGSYSYVYTANEDNVADAEQNYEDKLYEMQKLNAEYIDQLQENILSLQEQATQKLKEAADMYGTDSEEYARAMKEIQAWYDTQIKYYSNEMDKVFTNNEILYTEDVAEYAAMTNNKALADEEYVNDFSQTVLGIESGYDDLSAYVDDSVDAMSRALEQMNSAEQTYQEHNAEIMAAAGTSMTEFANQYVSAATEASESTNQLNNDTANLANEVIENWNNILANVENFENEYSKKIDKMIAKNNALANSFYQLINAWSQFNDTGAQNASTPGRNTNTNSNDNGNDGGRGNGGRGNGGRELTAGRIEGIAASIWMEGGAASGWYNDPTRAARFREKFGADGQKIQTYINQHAENGDIYRNWHNRRGQLAQYHYSQFDTGGYTGSWNNNEGRLAVLHQKELILNASDTENMLAIVELVREISKAIDLNAMAASSAYSNMSSVNVPNQGEEQVIEQQITINAEFPDATKASEIEAAFNTLFINASQYANRK